ncbi:hypothetical protein AAFN75_02600 [Algibacter sp. AS12]|uniref:hypothetical protein n=1 Tax=Algibacter sp. AS12 TaxID=3135773 RepID=UPI00398AA526
MENIIDDLKFIGLFSKQSIWKINQPLINKLLQKNIIVKDVEYTVGMTQLNLVPGNCNRLCFPLCYEGVFYKLSDPFFRELFLQMEWHVKTAIGSYENEIEEIFFEIESFFNTDKKIKFLKRKYRKYYPKNEYTLYSLYINDNKWKEWVLQEFSNSPTILKLYLTGKKDDWLTFIIYNNKECLQKDCVFTLMSKWGKFHKTQNILHLINNKIKELENEVDTTQNTTNKNKSTPNKTQYTKTLRELFSNPKEEYDSVLKLLIKNNIISETKNGLEIIVPEKYTPKKGRQAFICAIGLQLKEKMYLKFCTDVDIVRAFNNTFCNVNISKQNYDSLKISNKMDEYINHFSFL